MDGNVMRHLRNNNNISRVCQFCCHPFPWRVKPLKFRVHLIRYCKSVPDDVRKAAGLFFKAKCSRVDGNKLLAAGCMYVMTHLRNDNDISWVCKFCDHPFPWEVQIETFRHHLIRICESAPEDVKVAAQRRKVEASLMEETSNFPLGGRARMAPYESGLSSAAYLISQDLRNFPLTDQAYQHEVRDEVTVQQAVQMTRREGIVQRSNKRHRSSDEVTVQQAAQMTRREGIVQRSNERHRSSDEVTVQQAAQMTRREGILQSSNKRHRSMPNALPIAPEVEVLEGIQETGESASLTKRPVGDAFKRNEEKIWSWLMDDQVLRVGIYGMGGVGKTTLMRHIQTLLEGQSSFEVHWITVSQDFSICKLQNLIAKKIGFNFSDEEDEVKRAKTLAQAMQAKGKCVLILDDLWNYFDVDEVGIPVGVNTCKLVLTTRLLQVCRQMDCSKRNTIQVQTLTQGEAWILFTQELGNYSTEVEELAEAVCRECAGLPLGIRVMARSMKGICNVHTWRNTLAELKESRVSKGHEMWEEVFSVLKFSYLRLNDPALQECLVYCALFPEDAKIRRGELIEYLIVEGVIDERKSRQAELDKGLTMLDTLENAYLLEGDTETVWMNDLIRDMVILELREGWKTLEHNLKNYQMWKSGQRIWREIQFVGGNRAQLKELRVV